ncbi:hypothetical protein [Algoriphagus mannitolivorans]|uniref:hypothetical protein n=1 Tax=Algoriphagus mannitolivorans TaxID=226504 RepID=UPI000413EDE0|nr:hypothetical protein [Algoriphagus mannitolivorans]
MENQLRTYGKGLAFTFFSLLMTLQAFAQDKGLEIEVNIGTEPVWYQQTWVWIVGGAVFILLLVALLRKKR